MPHDCQPKMICKLVLSLGMVAVCMSLRKRLVLNFMSVAFFGYSCIRRLSGPNDGLHTNASVIVTALTLHIARRSVEQRITKFNHVAFVHSNSTRLEHVHIGITFCPEHRMRTIRDAYIDPSTGESLEADASRAHFPQHWKSMTVLAHGTRHIIGLMERDMIHRFKARLTNSPKHGGSGTAQQHLFLYIAHNSGQSCKCHLCKKGRQESSGFTSESDADIAGPTWRQKKAEEEVKEAPPKRKRLRDETSLPNVD